MKKGGAKGKPEPPKPKAFNPDDYATMTIPREEVIDSHSSIQSR